MYTAGYGHTGASIYINIYIYIYFGLLFFCNFIIDTTYVNVKCGFIFLRYSYKMKQEYNR